MIDASAGGDVALVEMREELMLRHRRGHTKHWTKPPTTMAVSATRGEGHTTYSIDISCSHALSIILTDTPY